MFIKAEYCRDFLDNFGGHTLCGRVVDEGGECGSLRPTVRKSMCRRTSCRSRRALVIDIDAEIDFKDITPKFFSDLKKFNPFGPENSKTWIFCTHHVYDYGTSKVVGREQEHTGLELVDNKSNNVMNGIAFGQSSHVRYIKTNTLADICYTIEEKHPQAGRSPTRRLRI